MKVAIALLVTCAVARAQTLSFAQLRGASLPPTKVSASTFAAADVDRDGDQDLLITTGEYFLSTSLNRLMLNDGNGSFVDVTATHLPGLREATSTAVFGDVDGDGDLDVVLGNRPSIGTDQNRLYLNDGRGRFTDVTSTHLPASRVGQSGTLDVALGDVDGDGDLDLFVVDNPLLGGQDNLLFNDGTGRFGRTSWISQSHSSMVEMTDIDRDGDLDIVVAGLATRIWVNDGRAAFRDETLQRLGSNIALVSGLAAGDLDSDGDVDLLFLRGGSGPNPFFLNDGKGFFKLAAGSRLPHRLQNPGQVLCADVDDDVDLDLLILEGSRTILWVNDGKGNFADASVRVPIRSPAPHRAGLFDADLDGDLDLVLAASSPKHPGHVLYLNLHRHIHARASPVLGRPHLVDLWARPGYASNPQLALPLLALARQSPRLHIHPFGALGLDPRVMLGLPAVTLPVPSGRATLSVPIPSILVLRGKPLLHQGLTLHSAQVRDWRLTNVFAETIQ